jgi:hypothetical protein
MYIILKDNSRHTEQFFIEEQPCLTVKSMLENIRDLSIAGAAGAELRVLPLEQSNLDDIEDRFLVLKELAETGLRKLDEAGLKDSLAHGLGGEDEDFYKVGGTD